jgi:hypothetical protein
MNDRGPGTNTVVEGAVHQRGFFNIGVSPTSFDPGNGGVDPYGNPLSDARMFLAEQLGQDVVDPSEVTDVCNTLDLIEPGGTPPYPCFVDTDGTITIDPLFNWNQEREVVDGSFKTPETRNAGLTPPYFHNGAYSNLHQVVEFYNRGGSRRDKSNIVDSYTGDTSGTGPLGKGGNPVLSPDFGTNVDRFVQPLLLTEQEIDDLTAFMLSMTDYRVQCDMAPFDHPELPVSIGHTAEDKDGDGRADDIMAVIPATGAGGYDADGKHEYCLPNSGDLFDADLRNRLVVTEAAPGNSGNSGNGKAKGKKK